MHESERDFSLKSFFVPLTTFKAINIIVIVGIIIFANCLFNNFVWDDQTYIISNTDPAFHALNVIGLIKQNTFNTAGQYRPIPAIYFSLLYALFGTAPFFYHLLQLILHITAASILFLLLKHFFSKKVSLVLSLFFLIHPIQVESVVFIAQTVSPLFFLFGISAVVLSLRDEISLKRAGIISSLLLLSFLTKETGFLFLFIILLYRVLVKKNNMFIVFMSGLLAMLLYCAMRFGIAGIYLVKVPSVSIARLPLIERLINIPAIIFYYVKIVFFPARMAIDQDWIIQRIDFPNLYFPLFIDLLFFSFLLLIGAYVLKVNKKAFRFFLFFFLWFLAGLAMHIQLFPLDMTVADRWFYFPFAGLLGTIGVGIESIKFSHINLKKIGYMSVVSVLVLLAVRTMVRNTNWYDMITLFTHDSNIYDSYDIENDIGVEYTLNKQYDAAAKHLEKSVAMLPETDNLYNLGKVYEELGNRQKAKEYYAKALQAKSSTKLVTDWSHTYEALAGVLLYTDPPQKALAFITSAVTKYPDSGELWEYLAITEYRLHNQQEALTAAAKAKALLQTENISTIYMLIQTRQPIILPP